MRAKLLIPLTLALLAGTPGSVCATTVDVIGGAPCPAGTACITAVSDLAVPGFTVPFEVSFIHGAGLYAALPGGPDFDAAGAFIATTALANALDVASAAHGGIGFDFLAGDGTAATGTLVPYVSDGANSYLLVTFLSSSLPPAWTLDTFANYGTGLDGVYAHFSAAIPEPATLVLLGLGLAGMGFMRKRTSS